MFFLYLNSWSHISDFLVPYFSNTSFLDCIFWILGSHDFSTSHFSVAYYKFWGCIFKILGSHIFLIPHFSVEYFGFYGHMFFQNPISWSHISDFGVTCISSLVPNFGFCSHMFFNTAFLGHIFQILGSHIFPIPHFSVTYFGFCGHTFFLCLISRSHILVASFSSRTILRSHGHTLKTTL